MAALYEDIRPALEGLIMTCECRCRMLSLAPCPLDQCWKLSRIRCARAIAPSPPITLARVQVLQDTCSGETAPDSLDQGPISCLTLSCLQGIKAVVTLNEEFEVFISTRQYQVCSLPCTDGTSLTVSLVLSLI